MAGVSDSSSQAGATGSAPEAPSDCFNPEIRGHSDSNKPCLHPSQAPREVHRKGRDPTATASPHPRKRTRRRTCQTTTVDGTRRQHGHQSPASNDSDASRCPIAARARLLPGPQHPLGVVGEKEPEEHARKIGLRRLRKMKTNVSIHDMRKPSEL